MKATISTKGQLTIPKRLRDSLGLRPGDRLDLQEETGRLVGMKMDETYPLGKLAGSIKGVRTDTYLEEVRGKGFDPKLDPEKL